MKKNKSVEFNAILNAFRMTLTIIVPIITFPYTSRIFLSEGSGKLSFASSYIQVFVILASLGVYTYGVREGALVRNNKTLFSQLVFELLIINIISTVFSYLLLFFSMILSNKLNDYRVLIYINAISIGFMALGMDWIYGVYEDYVYITVRQIIVQLITIILMFILVHNKEDIYVWALIGVIPYAIANVINVYKARKYFDFRKISRPNIKKHICPILILFATQVSAKVYSSLDTILLGFFTNDVRTGLYSAAIKVNSILITLFTAMPPVFIPTIMDYIKKNNSKDFLNQMKKVFRMCLGLAIPACVGIMILSKEIIMILAGKEFEAASRSMVILSPIIIITTMSNIVYYCILTPYKKEKEVLKCMIMSTLVNILISILLIHSMKEVGVAIGSVVGEVVGLSLSLYYVNKNGIGISEMIPNLKVYTISSILIGVICMCLKYVIGNILMRLIIAVIMSVVCYFIILYYTKDPILEFFKTLVKKRR